MKYLYEILSEKNILSTIVQVTPPVELYLRSENINVLAVLSDYAIYKSTSLPDISKSIRERDS